MLFVALKNQGAIYVTYIADRISRYIDKTKQMLTLGEALRHAGYATGMSGKWHNGKTPGTRPFDRGFDEAYGVWDGACNFFNPKNRDPEFKGGRVRPFGHNDRYLEYEDFPEDYYTTDAFTDHAIETIRRHAASGRPFFHYLPFTRLLCI